MPRFDIQVPPLGRKVTTESNSVDNVWYGFFRRVFNKAVTVDYKLSANATNGAGGWEDLRFPATAINPAGIVSPPSYDATNVGYTFSATADQQLDMVVQLPHAWKRGSNLRPHIHWRPTANSAGNVVWQMQYSWSNSFGIQPAWTYSNINANIITNTNQLMKEQITSLGNISAPSGAKESSICKFKILRLGSLTGDTYAAPALLDEFDVHYYHEKAGTDLEYPT